MLAVAKSKKGGFIGRVRNSSFELRGPGTQGCSFGTGLRGADQKKKSSIGTNVFAGPGEPVKRQRNYDSNNTTAAFNRFIRLHFPEQFA